MIDFRLPEVGENIKSGTVVSIAVSVGDTIKKDQDLLELETEKASLPVPSPCNGIIREILIKEGDEVAIGSVVMKIEETEKAASAPQKLVATEKPKASSPAPTPQAAPSQAAVLAQPAVRVSSVNRLPNEAIPAQTDVPAAPSVRRLARELGINISQVPGTGPAGRISKDDVKAFTKQIVLSGGASVKETKPLPDFTKFGTIEKEVMSKIRKVTKDNMAFCWNTIPHVTQFDKADITNLEQYRKKQSTPERKLTVTPFLLKVMAAALKEFPKFNCSIDNENNEIIYKRYFNLGVAVDTERGLLVPVIKDIDQKSITAITDELTAMAERARDKKTRLDELQGACMTLTNLGGIGGYAFTPIINWPEVCILGVSRGGYEPVWDGKTFVPKLKLPLSLSYDHRIIDGADAARFLRWICQKLEDPATLNLN